MSFKHKCKFLVEIIKEYKRAKIAIENENINFEHVSEEINDYLDYDHSKERMMYYKKYYHLINNVLNELKQDSLDLINNDYILNSSQKWWETLYSKSTYYRLKHKAVDEFLELSNIF
jgi:hypothetical protein